MEIDNLVEETNLEATDIIETDQTELHVDQTESLHTHKPLNDQPSRFSSILKLSLDVLDIFKTIFFITRNLFRTFEFVNSLASLRSMDLALLRWITGTDCHALQHRTTTRTAPPPPLAPQSRVHGRVQLITRFFFLFLSNFGDPENSLRDDPRVGVAR